MNFDVDDRDENSIVDSKIIKSFLKESLKKIF